MVIPFSFYASQVMSCNKETMSCWNLDLIKKIKEKKNEKKENPDFIIL